MAKDDICTLQNMTKEQSLKRLLLITGLFFLASMLSDVFVNVYIWRLKTDFVLIAKYLISCFAVIPLVFYLCGYIGMKIDRVSIYKIGIGFFILFYLMVLLINKNITNHLILIGAIKGIAMGFYWFGFHILTFDYTGKDNRDKFFANLFMIMDHFTNNF